MSLLEDFEKLVKQYDKRSRVPYVLQFAPDKELKLTVSAGVHGDEQANIHAIIKAIQNFGPALQKAKFSTMFLIGNPEAVKINKRFTQTDMNRVFGSTGTTYEHQRAQQLADIVKETQYHIDLHQTIEPTKKPFGVFEVSPSRVSFFEGITTINDVVRCITPPESYALCFDECTQKKGACAITVETGSIKGPQTASKQRAYSMIQKALAYCNIVPGEIIHRKSCTQWVQILYIKNDQQTTLTKDFSNFEEIKKGAIVARQGEILIRSPQDGIILFPKYVATKDRYLGRIAVKC